MALDLVARRAAAQNAEHSSPAPSSEFAREYTNLWGELRKIEQIPLSEIRMYQTPEGKSQPYRIQQRKVDRIAVSAKDIGILQAIVVRPISDPEFKYEVLAGHHRYLAAKQNDDNSIPAEIREVDSLTAYKIVSESNTRTEEVLPSENAHIFDAYMSMRTSGDEDRTAKEIAQKFGVSEKTIYRYINILKLTPELQSAVDAGIIPIGHFEKLLSALTLHQQMGLWEYIDMYSPKKLSAKHINILCSYAEEASDFIPDELYDLFHPEVVEEELSEEENNSGNIFRKIKNMFPEVYADANQKDLEDLIIKLLSKYAEG